MAMQIQDSIAGECETCRRDADDETATSLLQFENDISVAGFENLRQTLPVSLHRFTLVRLSRMLAAVHPEETAEESLGCELPEKVKKVLGSYLEIRPSIDGPGAHFDIYHNVGAALVEELCADPEICSKVTSIEVHWGSSDTSQTTGSRWLADLLEAYPLQHVSGLMLHGYGEVHETFLSQLARCSDLKYVEVSPKGSAMVEALLTQLANAPLEGLAISNVEGDDAWAALQALDKLKSLSLFMGAIRKPGVKALKHLKGLEWLMVETYGLNLSETRAIAQLTNLKSLSLADNALKPKAFAELWGLKELQKLDLSDTKMETEHLAGIEQLGQLRSLNLRGNPIDDEGLKYVAEVPQLRSLDLQFTRTTGEHLDLLASKTQLQQLSLEGLGLSPRAIEHLALFRSLRSLNLDGAKKYDNLPQSLEKLTELRTLRLGERDMNPSVLPSLLASPHLRQLTLSNNPQLAEGLADVLVQLKELTFLDIRFTGMKEKEFAKLQALENLVWLQAVETRPGREGLLAVSKLKHLRWVDLGRCQLSSVEGLAELSPLTLWIYQNPLGDDAVPALRQLEHVRSLDVREIGLSEEAAAELKDALPHVYVRG